MQEYSLADLKRLFGLPPALIRKLSQAGFITQPAPRGKSKYAFQDLLVLRVAGALKAAKISTPKSLLPWNRSAACCPRVDFCDVGGVRQRARGP